MKSTLRVGVVTGILALCGPGIVRADDPAAPETNAPKQGKEAHKGGKGNKGKGQGQHWDHFAKIFDANGDGKVSKEEFLAKHPGFDRADTNKDGTVTKEEVAALQKVKEHGGTGGGFVANFDGDADGKVTAAEYDAKRSGFFDRMDKNKDGIIDKSELKSTPPDSGI